MSITRRSILSATPAIGLAALGTSSAHAVPVVDRKARIKECLYELEQLLAEETGLKWRSFIFSEAPASTQSSAGLPTIGTTDFGLHDPAGITGQRLRYGKPVKGGDT